MAIEYCRLQLVFLVLDFSELLVSPVELLTVLYRRGEEKLELPVPIRFLRIVRCLRAADLSDEVVDLGFQVCEILHLLPQCSFLDHVLLILLVVHPFDRIHILGSRDEGREERGNEENSGKDKTGEAHDEPLDHVFANIV